MSMHMLHCIYYSGLIMYNLTESYYCTLYKNYLYMTIYSAKENSNSPVIITKLQFSGGTKCVFLSLKNPTLI